MAISSLEGLEVDLKKLTNTVFTRSFFDLSLGGGDIKWGATGCESNSAKWREVIELISSIEIDENIGLYLEEYPVNLINPYKPNELWIPEPQSLFFKRRGEKTSLAQFNDVNTGEPVVMVMSNRIVGWDRYGSVYTHNKHGEIESECYSIPLRISTLSDVELSRIDKFIPKLELEIDPYAPPFLYNSMLAKLRYGFNKELMKEAGRQVVNKMKLRK